jgi:hypothetical protein
MRTTATVLAAAIAVGTASLALRPTPIRSQPAPAVTPVPLPQGPDFPVAQAAVEAWVAASDQTAERAHAWALWALLNQDSGQTSGGKALPIWETWLTTQDVFHPTGVLGFAGHHNGPRDIHLFETPRQFKHGPPGLTFDSTENNGIKVQSKLSPEAVDFVTTKQPGPGPAGSTYSYTSHNGLLKLNANWPAGTPAQDRAIKDFPIRGVELKPVVMVVKASGISIQHLWQGPAQSTNPANPVNATWTTCVLIDPAAHGPLRPATPAEVTAAAVPPTSSCRTYFFGGLDLFYWFKLTAAEAQAFPGAAAGDYAVLVAMHVNTKEIPFWTWQTFWWQPGADAPNGFPGTKAGQPASLPAPFNNYATCANYDQTTRPGGSTMQVCFNPYLETSRGIPAGITSNCMSCHGTARIDSGPRPLYPSNYTAPIAFFTDSRYFTSTSTHTDFSWAVADAP